MKKKFLSLLTLLVCFVSAYAAPQVVYERALATWAATDVNNGDGSWIANAATVDNEKGLYVSGGGSRSATLTFSHTSGSIQTIDLVFNNAVNTGNASNYSYVDIGSGIRIRSNQQNQNGHVIINGTEMAISHCNIKNVNRGGDLWTIHIEINTAKNTVKALTLSGNVGDENAASFILDKETALSSGVSYNTVTVGTNRAASSPSAGIQSIKITEEEQEIVNVGYTVKFVDASGVKVKEDVTDRQSAAGSAISGLATTDDQTAFYNDGDIANNNTVEFDEATNKYVFKSVSAVNSSAEEITELVADAIVTVVYDKYNKYNYAIKQKLGDAAATDIATGTLWRDQTYSTYFPIGIKDNGNYYFTEERTSDPYFKATSTATEPIVTIDYTLDPTVAFYSEGEDLDSKTGEFTQYASISANGSCGVLNAEGGNLVVNLPAGYYTITARTAGRGDGNRNIYFYKGSVDDANLVLTANPGNYTATTQTSETIALAEATNILVKGAEGGGANGRGLDYVIIKQVPTYAVTISDEIENGTVVADPTSANAGAEVTLTNTPAEGYEFVSYSVTCKTNNEAVIVTDGKFTMPADDVTVNATFQLPVPVVYAVKIAESVGGIVETSAASAEAGAEVAITATPAEGYELDDISVKDVASDATVTVTDGKFIMPEYDVLVTATFKEKVVPPTPAGTYDLTLAEGSETHGTVTFTVGGNEVIKADKGDDVTVSVAPAEGFVVKNVTARAYTSWENAARATSRNITDAPALVDNIEVAKQEDGTWKFTMPDGNVLVQVEYEAVYAVTIAENIVGGTVVADPTSVKAGDEVTLTNTPAEGYEFVSYSVTCKTNNEAVIVTDGKFTMPADEVTVNATFAKVYTVTISNEIENGTVVADPTSAKAGDEVTLTNTPAEGYEFVSYSVTCKTNNEAVIVTDGKFTMPADDVTVGATFKFAPVDKTDLITNWDFTGCENNNFPGWTIYNPNGGNAWKNGTSNVEYWIGTAANGVFDYYQDIDAPDGVYTLTANMWNSTNGVATDAVNGNAGVYGTSSGVTVFAGVTDDCDNSNLHQYTTEPIKVLDGKLRLGVKNNGVMGARWFGVDWIKLTQIGKVQALDYEAGHTEALNAAKATLSAEENAIVVGEERTALEAAIEKNSEVAEQTVEAYKAAIKALQTASNDFTAARAGYAALASTKETLLGYAEKYVYASAVKTAAVTAAAEAIPTSADDAVSKNKNLINALRAMAESHANAEGVEDAEAIAITNPSAEDNTNGWTTVNGEGSDGSIGIRDNEPWTSADGSTAHKYFDGGNWGASAWDVSLTQNVELAAGKYMLSAISRASGDVALTIFAGGNKTTMPSIGAAGGIFDRGWNISSVEFEVEAKSAVTIGVQGVTSVVHNWMSFSDFKLVLIESYAVRVAKAELLEAINEAKAIDTEYKDGVEELAAAITVAEGVYNKEEATVEDVNTAKSDLAAAVAAFNTANAKYSELTYTITGQSSIKATIKKGKAVLDIIPEEGWAVAELTVNDEDALEQLADNKLVVNVDADATLVEVTFGWADAENMYEEDEVTGIATIADEGIKVYAQGTQICVEGAAGKVVRVYTLYGSLLKAATPSENKVAKFSVTAGTYVVQVGNKAAKISVK